MNRILVIFTFYFLLLSATLVAQQDYFPERNNWEIRGPEAVGVQADKLQAAVDFAEETNTAVNVICAWLSLKVLNTNLFTNY
ncbi:MAG: hypothetical protein R2788_16550 [Saprospiraceae bacterium]